MSARFSLATATAKVGALLIWLAALLYPPLTAAQLTFQTDSVAPERFVAVHGRKAIVMGYASGGLELWAYPLQLITGYELGFRAAGDTTETAGSALLRRVTYEPEAITRTYIGPDFIVRERLFVPLDEPAIFLTYTVECRHSIDIAIHFTPVLDLMWPASLGGQSTQWNPAASAYILSEATHKYSAWIGSPAVISHDEVLNSAQPGTQGKRLAFSVRAGGSSNPSVTVVVARDDAGSSTLPARMKDLLGSQANFETEARNHYANLLASTLAIETPDQSVNQQIAWAQIALDQASVCNPVLGCGLVAGYGPSRDARRPQYAWFFAGDALIAIEALVDTGDYDRAREALTFIAKYQDAGTGMIWHELSQSADPADWATRYPYMFVHVDITFHYLTAVERYVSASGDTQFLQQHWLGIEAAYRYCRSLIQAEDGLPRIPSTKEGGDEQNRLSDALDLSASWVSASASFARLARLSGHAAQADEAVQLSEKATRATVLRYWDDRRQSWIDGYNESGQAFSRRSDDVVHLVNLLDQHRSDAVLDQLASSDFETDWGTRGVAAGSPQYNPASYASGSVSAVGTAGIASAFWSNHRPVTAYSIWNSLIPWGTLDSMGHMHELLTGDFYHQQVESVPEQTWSSAALLSATVQGLLGLEKEAQGNALKFSPHMPANWDHISLKNIKVSGGTVGIILTRLPHGLQLAAEDSGIPIELSWAPEIPLGARLSGAELDGKPVKVRREEHAQDSHAILNFTVPHGKTLCLIRYDGGVLLSVSDAAPLLGEPSKQVKITSVAYKAASLVLDADVWGDTRDSTIELRTEEKPLKVRGATLRPASDGVYDLLPDMPANPNPAANGYHRTEIIVDFAAR